MNLQTLAYAKINLGLHIHSKRDDGYHEIETVFHRIDLFDLLKFEPADRISIASSSPEIPVDESNLCWKAAAMINALAGTKHGVRITLTKSIPAGAGLGGGSADAAATLRILPRLWNIRLSDQKLAECAISLGSDVPFFLGTGSAHGTGRGEQLTFFSMGLPYAIVVCFPGVQVSTAWAYHQIRSFQSREHGVLANRIRAALRNPGDLRLALENDFEAPVFAQYPGIAAVKDSLLHAGALCASLSGSGSSVYGLFPDDLVARRAAETLRAGTIRTFFTPAGFQVLADNDPVIS